MKLIRWLLSNIILIAFVLALTYAYVYWDNLTGEETPLGKVIAYLSVEYDEVSEFLDSYDFGDSGADRPGEAKVVAEVTEPASVPQAMAPARTQPPAPGSPQPSAPPQGSMQPPAMAGQPSSPPVTWRQQPPPARDTRPPAPAPAPAIRQPPVQMAPVQTRSPAPGSRQPSAPPQGTMQPPAMAGQPSSPPVSWRQQPPPARDTRPPAPAPAPAIRQPPVQAPRQAPPTAMIQQPPAMQPAPQVEAPPAGKPAEPVAATETAPQIDVRKLWISAREEYHRGNIDQSISHYRQVIANSENNYDAYGELGNVYLSRGKYREAADAYFQAASILAQQGQSRRAMSLLPMLERLDRSRAEELNQLLRAPRG